MKRVLALVFILLLCGCNVNKTTNEVVEEPTNESQEETKDVYVDDNPIKLGIFEANNNYKNKHVIEDAYYCDFNNLEDIASFEVYFTDDKEISGRNQKEIFNKYYNTYTNIDDYKIGYNIKFILSDGTDFNGNFLEPDIYKFGAYFYVYLYDDINQPDYTYYSHLEEMGDNTIISSIKLFGVYLDNVENIILTAFTYNDMDDFDDEGNYRGKSRYTIRIKKK